jgi:hypothetical protein
VGEVVGVVVLLVALVGLWLAVRRVRLVRGGGVEIVDRRPPTPAEVDALPAAGIVLCCRTPARTLELAMGPGVLTGFLAWLEATPPGRTGYRQAS